MSYDGNNNLVLTIDPDARTVSNSYDARNRMTQSVLSTTATTSYQYDATNNLNPGHRCRFEEHAVRLRYCQSADENDLRLQHEQRHDVVA